ncbi:aminopeptidase [Halorhabdus sp. CBA1104]|uniref:aminopeptidase n=1 Tax=unclassified Halorhabdus TaxID=2621901 RepID=UPI0012B38A38|nr:MULTISPECIES: aminopeptidase [unclassified Halorhabdus]QGN07320.1 aminopeptidase [Halorhabdus sp. CBA1104]
MDPRVREHAETIVDHSVDIHEDDEVIIRGHPVAEDLLVAIAELCGRRGANISARAVSPRVDRAYRKAIDTENISQSEVAYAATQQADVVIGIRADANTFETSDVDPEKASAVASANKEIQELVMDKRWVSTQYPAPANAQDAEMSTAAYEAFVWGAINKDWDAVRDFQHQLVEILDPASEVHIVSGDTTDITMSIEGNPTRNDYGEKNLPGGEVFTAPLPASVDGEVLFDKPLMAQGREVQDVYLRFENGEVIEHAAEKNEDVLTAVLNTDDGARRVGELGIGMNRDIDQFTYNMLFDEKMGDTVHLALGRAYEETVSDDNERNDSAMHMDMIVDMSEASYIEVDGERIQEDGTFVFEDGFDN